MSAFGDLRGSELAIWGQSVDDVARRVVGLVYLATPYTRQVAPDGVFSLLRSEVVAREAAARAAVLGAHGVTAVSPIVQAHAMLVALRGVVDDRAIGEHALDAAFWTSWCARLLDASRFVYVPRLAGWQESDGIAHEVRAAIAAGTPVLIEAHASEVHA